MHLMGALIFLIQTIMGLYISILLLRLLFQLVRADFYNPISQAIVKLTSPLVIPLRRMIPSINRIDTATLILAYGFQYLMTVIVMLLAGLSLNYLAIVGWSVLGLLHQLLDIYTFALFLLVILSWIAPHTRSPGAVLLHQLCEPLLRPVRRVLPPLGGLDFSVMVVMLVIYMLGHFIIPMGPV